MKAVNYWKSGVKINKRTKKPQKYSLSNVQAKLSYIESVDQLKAFEKQIEKSGSRYDKLKQINGFTLEMYKNAKKRKLIVKDSDLRRWSLKKNRELKLENFKASDE